MLWSISSACWLPVTTWLSGGMEKQKKYLLIKSNSVNIRPDANPGDCLQNFLARAKKGEPR